ncbi:MAG: hypothetical protein AAGA54_32060 [Myxococcota bacterium]
MTSGRWTQRLGLVGAGIVLGAGLMFVGLAQADRIAPARPGVLVALGQKLEVEHRAVDLKIDRGDIAGAIASLESLRSGPWPAEDADLARANDVAVALRHDVYGRLVRLRLDHPEVDGKPTAGLLSIVEEGLGEDAGEVDANPFTARLYALQGELFEAEGRDDDALAAYEKALEINGILLERELGGAP